MNEPNSDPLARGQAVIESMTRTQRQIFDGIVNELKVRWAVSYGEINEIIVDALVKRAALNTDVSAITVGSLPLGTLDNVAEQIAQSEPFLQKYVESRDAALRQSLEDHVRSEIPAAMQMSMARAGTLQPELDRRVDEMLDARTAARF